MVDGLLVAATALSLILALAMALVTWRLFRNQGAAPTPSAAVPATHGTAPAAQGTVPASTRTHRREPAWAEMTLRRTADLPSVRNRPAAGAPQPDLRSIPSAAPPASAAPASRNIRVPEVSKSARAIEPPAHEAQAHDSSVAPDPHSRRVLALASAVVAAVLLFAFGFAWAVSSSRDTAAATSPAAAQVASPLELTSLDFQRSSSQDAIKGVVRNPVGGSSIDRLEAVVVLFDRRGAYVGTTHAPVADGSLQPGTERSFEVPLAAGLDVSQYRVSFRMANAPVPYVDRRPPAVTTPASPRATEPDRQAAPASRSMALVS